MAASYLGKVANTPSTGIRLIVGHRLYQGIRKLQTGWLSRFVKTLAYRRYRPVGQGIEYAMPEFKVEVRDGVVVFTSARYAYKDKHDDG